MEKNKCLHPSNKAYREIMNSNILRCGICNEVITTKIGNNDNRN